MGEQVKTITEPQVRFRGFTDEWEQVKLGDVVDILNNKRQPVTAGNRISGDTPYYGANGIQDYVEGYTHDGEFILVAEDGANDLVNYPVKYVSGKIWVNNHAHIMSGLDNIAMTPYLAYGVKRINIAPYLVGGGRAKLNLDALRKLKMKLPSLPEQQKIGNLFQTLDALIGSSNEQVENLNQQKKALLQRLFPQKGETVPQVRLDGFSDAWEEVKLGDVLEKGNKNRVDDPNDYNRLTVKLNKKGLEEFESERELANTRPFYQRFKGEIIIGKQNYFNGSIAVVTDEFDGFVSSNAIMSFPVKNDMATTAFIYFLISQDNFIKQREHFANGTGQKELSESDFLNFKLNLPSLEEQQKIGELFQTLDEQICHVENKASRYNELKQALLQRMFV